MLAKYMQAYKDQGSRVWLRSERTKLRMVGSDLCKAKPTRSRGGRPSRHRDFLNKFLRMPKEMLHAAGDLTERR